MAVTRVQRKSEHFVFRENARTFDLFAAVRAVVPAVEDVARFGRNGKRAERRSRSKRLNVLVRRHAAAASVETHGVVFVIAVAVKAQSRLGELEVERLERAVAAYFPLRVTVDFVVLIERERFDCEVVAAADGAYAVLCFEFAERHERFDNRNAGFAAIDRDASRAVTVAVAVAHHIEFFSHSETVRPAVSSEEHSEYRNGRLRTDVGVFEIRRVINTLVRDEALVHRAAVTLGESQAAGSFPFLFVENAVYRNARVSFCLRVVIVHAVRGQKSAVTDLVRGEAAAELRPALRIGVGFAGEHKRFARAGYERHREIYILVRRAVSRRLLRGDHDFVMRNDFTADGFRIRNGFHVSDNARVRSPGVYRQARKVHAARRQINVGNGRTVGFSQNESYAV